MEDLAIRLTQSSATAKDSDAIFSAAAVAHGKLRFAQGYTPAMLVHESRILQATILGMLQSNLSYLDFSLLLPDVMTIADEVDARLTQSMDSSMKLMHKSMAAVLVADTLASKVRPSFLVAGNRSDILDLLESRSDTACASSTGRLIRLLDHLFLHMSSFDH